MCLDAKLNDEDKEKWLKKQPDMITAYKVVTVEVIEDKLRMCSLFGHDGRIPFSKKNKLKIPKGEVLKHKTVTRGIKTVDLKNRYTVDLKNRYVAYYHLFMKRQEALCYCLTWSNALVIECKVPKKFITEVGEQNGEVVVTRKFTIVGQDEYLD